MGASQPHETHFDTLGLPVDANDAQIHEAHRRCLAACGDDPAQRTRIEEAFKVLANPLTRKAYREQSQRLGVQPAAPAARQAPDATGPASPAAPARPGKRLPTESPNAAAAAPKRGAPGQRRGRQHTEFLDGPAQAGPAATAGPRPQTRPKTELLGGAPAPESDSPRKPQPGPGARPLTELSGQAKPAPGLQAPAPGAEAGAEPGGRRLTVSDSTRVRDAAPPAYGHLVLSYQGRQRTFALHPGENLIGRPPKQGDAPDIPIEDPERFVSRRHALIRVEGSEYSIQDLASDNGTYLNGQRLEPCRTHPLKPGDIIEIQGREIRLRVP